MVSPVLIQAGLPVLLNILSEALVRVNHPAARVASQSLGNVTDALGRGQISQAEIEEANRHAEEMAALQSQETRAAYEQVNQSLRAEIASEDSYIRRMRPTFGYLMALTWTAQMMGLAYIMAFRTEQAQHVLAAMDSLAAIWAMGLSVLGIYFYKRSEEKKTGLRIIPQPVITEEKIIEPIPVPKPARAPDQFNE